MKEREEIIACYFNSWLTKDCSVLEEAFTTESLYIESWGPAYRGLNDIQRWFVDWNRENKVLKWDIINFYHQESSCICEWHFECDCKGEIFGFDGVSVIKFRGNKICYLKEFQSKSPNYYPYEK